MSTDFDFDAFLADLKARNIRQVDPDHAMCGLPVAIRAAAVAAMEAHPELFKAQPQYWCPHCGATCHMMRAARDTTVGFDCPTCDQWFRPDRPHPYFRCLWPDQRPRFKAARAGNDITLHVRDSANYTLSLSEAQQLAADLVEAVQMAQEGGR